MKISYLNTTSLRTKRIDPEAPYRMAIVEEVVKCMVKGVFLG
jgi:hypothetical protein